MMLSRTYRAVPTWRLTLCLLVSTAVLFAAINYQKNALHWLAYTCWSVLALGTCYSYWKARRLRWEWFQPNHAFANENWDLSSNHGQVPGKFGQGDITHGQNHAKTSAIGLLTLSVSTWTTEYPLGLLRVRHVLPAPKPVWIYPQPVNHRSLAQNSRKEPDLTHVREYQTGDRPRLLIKKTLALPMAHWQVRSDDDSRVFVDSSSTELRWSELPEQWTLMEKLQQLSYDVQRMNDNDTFSLNLPHGNLARGYGMPHKHHAWKLLAQEWQHWS